jgi:membrane protein
VGAFVTALLFNLGKFLIGYYLGRGSLVSIYGAAGSFIILLLWVYYSAQILFFGAEFTRVQSQKRYQRPKPTGPP